MRLPAPRGPLSAAVLALIEGSPSSELAAGSFDTALRLISDPVRDADFQLALACCYELHYRGFDDAGADDVEWDPVLLGLRARLEDNFERALRARVMVPADVAHQPVHAALRALVDADDGPPLSRYLLREATLEQAREFIVQRSVYQLKEADPHTWQLPRLSGRTKDALVEIQSDEYGAGRPGRSHAALFARTMRAVGLDDTYGAYWSRAYAETFAAVNAMSLFGLHRRLRGAALGHLAALEMTSTAPNGRYGNGLRRLGFGADATAYFDEHVEADAVHEQIAAVDMCGSFVAEEPARESDVLFGAATCLLLDAEAARALLDGWSGAQQQGAA